MRLFALVATFLALVLAVSASSVVKKKRNGLPVVYGYQDGDECPAQRFYDDCNQCGCSEDGYSAACTRMACPPLPHTVVDRSVDEYPHNDLFGQTGECKPGMNFIHECNTCHCSRDGKSAACTDMACPRVSQPHIDGYEFGDACVAGEVFYNECNSCKCGANGRSAMCTFMAC